ncbi:GatB/YqeY domain-containing protein [Candidatus Microgenomates bacterium]|nr:GatB/YqeY domain-containing protein [Candidatus Microgenomates bacterium]
MTKQELQDQLQDAMRARDEVRTSTLRLLLSAVNYYEIQKGLPAQAGGAGYEASQEDVLSVVQKEVKQRNDSIEQFKAGGRQDLVDKETAELEILKEFMPEQIGEEEIRALVKQAIAETGATSAADIGKIMGDLMPKVKGKADGGLVSKIVQEELKA